MCRRAPLAGSLVDAMLSRRAVRHAAAAAALCVLLSAVEIAAQSAACGSVVSGSGQLQSINYPSAYVNSYSCSWSLQASPASNYIYLQFQAFNIEACCDFVRIYNQNGAQLYSYSGASLPPSLMLGSQATVTFTTDASVVSSGFSIVVSSVVVQPAACGSVVTGSGQLQSVNYPIAYANSYSCSWTLQASPTGGLIYMQFQTFVTEACCDILRIYDQSGAQIYSYSGSSLPPNLTLSSPATVTFTTDSSVVYTGFVIAVSSGVPPPPVGIAAAPCGSVVNSANPALLMSVNYPSSYANSIACSWTVQAAPMCTNISLQLQFFSTEQCCDFVSIFNESQLVYSFSGAVSARTLTLGREAIVTFTSDSSIVYAGFVIVASSIGCTFPRTSRFGSAPIASTAASIVLKPASTLGARSLIECGVTCLTNNGACASFAYDPVQRTCQQSVTASSLPPAGSSSVNYVLT